jgi:iron-sulfur cluster repair protein YtfE (RIC family)
MPHAEDGRVSEGWPLIQGTEAKMPATQPLRDEHEELIPYIEALRVVADSIGDVPLEAARHGVDEAYALLAHHLIPHAEAEERVLYPMVEKLMGASGATATMSRDHVEVGRLTAELAALRTQLAVGAADRAQVKALRRVLYGLYALVKVHFAKEEKIYLPLLDARLTPGAANEMFEAMEAVVREAKERQCAEATGART